LETTGHGETRRPVGSAVALQTREEVTNGTPPAQAPDLKRRLRNFLIWLCVTLAVTAMFSGPAENHNFASFEALANWLIERSIPFAMWGAIVWAILFGRIGGKSLLGRPREGGR
jgi:hypothetical protein